MNDMHAMRCSESEESHFEFFQRDVVDERELWQTYITHAQNEDGNYHVIDKYYLVIVYS